MGRTDIGLVRTNLNPLTENRCRRFLLGIASEEEESRVEEAVLAGELDASFLVDSEDGLIDDYLLGNMTNEERHGFTTHFLTTGERKERLAFAGALIEYARKQPAEEHSVGRKLALRDGIRALLSWRQMAMITAAATVLLAALVGFQQLQLHREGQIASEARNEIVRLQAALDSGNNRAVQPSGLSTDSLGNPQFGVEQMPVIGFESSTRSVYPQTLRIPAHARFARINVKLPLPLAMKYREVLVTSNGEELWSQEFPASILPATKESTMVLPASILQPGSYHLRLEQASADNHFAESGDWVFQVPRTIETR
jgi:hypothetical protein